MESSRRSPKPGVVMLATRAVRSGLLATNHSSRLVKPSSCASRSGSSVSTAKSGIRPTAERIFNCV
jgi:hypothetical protein